MSAAVALWPGPALGQTPGPAAPSECSTWPAAVLSLDGPSPRESHGRRFAVALRSTSDAAEASGSLWVNASGVAYRVPFDVRLGKRGTSRIAPQRVIFQLPAHAALENVFVDTLSDPQPHRCEIAPWVPGMLRDLSDDELAGLGSATASATTDAAVVPDADAACGGRHQRPFTVHPVAPRYAGAEGEVEVLIAVARDSSVESASIQHSSAAGLNAPSIEAARSSIFVTEVRNCRPLAARYVFVVQFKKAR